MTNKGSRTNPYTPGEYSGMRKKSEWIGGWVFSTSNCGAEFINYSGIVTNSIGTEEKPYSSKDFNEMMSTGTWEGAYVVINAKVVYANKSGTYSEDPYGSGSGCGCSESGSGSGSENSGCGTGHVKKGDMTCYVRDDFVQILHVSWSSGITYTPLAGQEGVSSISCDCNKTVDNFLYKVDMESNSDNRYLKWVGTYRISGRIPYRVHAGNLYRDDVLDVDITIPCNFYDE